MDCSDEALIWIKSEKNGVKAWDKLMKKVDTRIINPGAACTGDLTSLMAVKLMSMAKGSYSAFSQKFEKIAAYIKIHGKPFKDELKYDFLITAIQHPAYTFLITSI